MKGETVYVLDKGWVELQDVMGDDLAIVNAARVSYLGESKGPEQDRKLLLYLLHHKHTSPFEQVEFKFRVKAPLFVARQWMRHRTWSYNEMSRRYTSDEIDFYYPTAWRKQSQANKQASDEMLSDPKATATADEMIHEIVAKCDTTYQSLLSLGVSREMARMVLPQNLYTQFVAKVDAHNLMHFFRLRMSDDAQYEIRLYAQAIYHGFFKKVLPWTAGAFEETLHWG
jgi:thymidylate synthase (FAD)